MRGQSAMRGGGRPRVARGGRVALTGSHPVATVPSMRVLVFTGVVLLLACAAHAAPDVTPLESTPGLSSGFGEFRDAHFHAGLDYSTDEQEGRPVRAVNDGWVERVRASGVGYGRAVYLRLDDGRTVVYGHLSRFAPSIDAFVAARQESAGVYEQDLVPLPGLLKFRRGEIVAWSGQSGAGPPHLHFEVRRGDENYNPLLHGYALPDHIAPTLAAAWITPHGAHARVGGGIDEVRVALRAGAAVTAPPVRGDFDLAVDTWDRGDGKPNKLATYRLEARVDGAQAPAFEAVIDSFSWDTTVEVERVYDYAATLRGDDTRRTLEKLPSYKESVVRRGPAVWSLAPGTHRIELTAVDEAGNRATATLVVPIVAGGTGPWGPTAKRVAVNRGPGARLKGTVLYVVSPRAQPPSASELTGLSMADSILSSSTTTHIYDLSELHVILQRVDHAVDGPTMPPREGVTPTAGGYLVVRDVSDTLAVRCSWPDAGLQFEFPSGAFFEPTALRVLKTDAALGTDELIPRSETFEVLPSDVALRLPCRVWLQSIAAGSATSTDRRGLFLRQNAGWSLVGTYDAEMGFHGSTRRLGTFAVFADTTAPMIQGPRAGGFHWHRGPAPGDAVAPRLSAVIRDGGAGLAPADQSIFVDGRRVPAEYDPEASRLTWYPRAWPAAGRHEVRIEAVDRLGNRSVLTVPLAVD